jgi:hypothetical protein
MDQDKKQIITETDNLVIKFVLILVISIISLLITLILFKIAIQKKLIFKLSDYF